MQITIERVRRWLVVSALCIVMVLAAVFGYTRYRAHRFLAQLPKQLGVDIQSETNGFTYSQSVKGKNIFTVHAARAIQRQDGKTTLHDVTIILYGSSEDKEHQSTDRIYGKEFEYDQPNGVIRAIGEVHLDLHAPAVTDPHATVNAMIGGTPGLHTEDDGMIHVHTSGLVFLQKLAVAATEEPLDFHTRGMEGEARGAEYDGDSGVLILRNEVKLRSNAQGHTEQGHTEQAHSEQVVANRAEFDRIQHRAVLTTAEYRSAGSTATAQQVFLDLRSNGQPQHIRAQGHVIFLGKSGERIEAPRAEVQLGEADHPQLLRAAGGVLYHSDSATGQSDTLETRFDPDGHVKSSLFSGGVHLQQTSETEDRTLQSDQLSATFQTDPDQKTLLQHLHATGSAKVVVTPRASVPLTTRGKAARSAITSMAADTLDGDFSSLASLTQLTLLRGQGHTSIEQRLSDGMLRKTTSDALTIKPALSSSSGKQSMALNGAQSAIDSATQDGHVTVSDRMAPRPQAPSNKEASSKEVADKELSSKEVSSKEVSSKALSNTDLSNKHSSNKVGRTSKPETEVHASEVHASANHADYEGAADRITLTGDARIESESTSLSAQRVVLNRTTGEATALGGVKGSYLAEAGKEPVHVLAARAEFHHGALPKDDLATFFGAAASPARLWQGASQVTAPVIEVNQTHQSLHAYSIDGTKDAVHTSLLSGPAKQVGVGLQKKTDASTVTLVVSSGLIYTGDAAQPAARFTGGAHVTNGDGSIVADLITATVKSGATPSQSKPSSPRGLFSGALESILAEGEVHLQQPGRSGSGSRLLYTAADGAFDLTGSPDAPPQIVDAQHGQITGASLLFHSGDDSVIVSAATGKRVRSETRVKR